MASGACSISCRKRSSLSRKAWSARFRARALAKICATSCSRFTSGSGQSRSRPQRIEAQGADGGLAPHRERDGQIRFDARYGGRFPVTGGLRRQLLQRRKGNDAAGQQLLLTQGNSSDWHPAGAADPPGRVNVGEREEPGASSDHCQSAARSRPRDSQIRRWASMISRSTSPAEDSRTSTRYRRAGCLRLSLACAWPGSPASRRSKRLEGGKTRPCR